MVLGPQTIPFLDYSVVFAPYCTGDLHLGASDTAYAAGTPGGGDELTIDHVVPRAQGGESNWTNCVLACLECNKRKADRTPEQAKVRLRKEPVRPTWKPAYSEHASRMESWSKFISEAYWNAELES